MSRLSSLIQEVSRLDSDVAQSLKHEIEALAGRRSFGLNFERHQPDSVDMPKREISVGDKVRMIPPRGKQEINPDTRIWRVMAIHDNTAELVSAHDPSASVQHEIENLWSVAEFKDTIHPGMKMTGEVINDDENAEFHSVINGENYHVLQALTYTHREKIDVIYIDPPYNTGAKDWKYNNDYVGTEDDYRHSKWLSFMEKRLLMAKQLLNPDDSVLIVTIDEKEYLRLGLLLEQTFPEAKIQMVSSLINPKGVARGNEFYRVDEYIYFVLFGSAHVQKGNDPMIYTESKEPDLEAKTTTKKKVRWGNLLRSGTDARREDRKKQFYPIFLDQNTGKLHSIGEPLLPVTKNRDTVTPHDGTIAIWPIRKDGSEGRWMVGADSLRELFSKGYVSIGRFTGGDRVSFSYVTDNLFKQIEEGSVIITGRDSNNVVQLDFAEGVEVKSNPKTMWNKKSHSASEYGTTLLREFIPGRSFPFSKSLYAVEDTIRFFVRNKKNATILDFFCGSGTTAHAVMRLNKQDGGKRRSIIVTNNEVSAKEQAGLRSKNLRPGDSGWEHLGICDYVTKPRITAAITGKTPNGDPVKGNYKFIDEFPMSDGFTANARYFTLTYENPIAIEHDMAFERIAPLLWIKAGSKGPLIDSIPARGWTVTSNYAVLNDTNAVREFMAAVHEQPEMTMAFIVTDDRRMFQSVAAKLPDHVESIRLYESYLSNFNFINGEDYS